MTFALPTEVVYGQTVRVLLTRGVVIEFVDPLNRSG